jgi:hypothetical protein
VTCYFQGCTRKGVTKEHIPPRSFFPGGEKDQLLTVRSCELHNNAKSKDDLYVLAQICMNASPSNRAQEVFIEKIGPQLKFNDGALRRRLAEGSVKLADGSVKYKVDGKRLDAFFTALSCGVIFKACGSALPMDYTIRHVYHNFKTEQSPQMQQIEDAIDSIYDGEPMAFMEFGKPATKNERIYTVTIFGLPSFQSSIAVVHRFFGTFKVTSMLSRIVRQ